MITPPDPVGVVRTMYNSMFATVYGICSLMCMTITLPSRGTVDRITVLSSRATAATGRARFCDLWVALCTSPEAYLCLGFVERLSRLEDKRHPCPPPVLNEQHTCREGRAVGVVRHSVVCAG